MIINKEKILHQRNNISSAKNIDGVSGSDSFGKFSV
jgi:hypothetical protein